VIGRLLLFAVKEQLTIFHRNKSARKHSFVTNLSIIPDILKGRVDSMPATGAKVNQTTLVYTDYGEVLGTVADEGIVLFRATDEFSNLVGVFFALRERIHAPKRVSIGR
jgi:hypothetical protein